ncbi:DUF3105 domain-containing protein [Nocardioides sp.]|uniref:DUF3105 domain-containing protein n=1 Tax=Nocardioides sp. TaxID=35761 RepID=UPI0027211986|nr:DUF3105 domain-containing protein [Nocardioides sp.]MDO9456951.1 DUF3105 domain-containing protein [Nocardioides sp.]
MLAVVAALVVVAAAVVVPLVLLGDDDGPDDAGADRGTESSSSTGSDTDTDTGTGTASSEPDTSDLSDVQSYEDLPTTHVTDPVDYAQTPPVGGEHFGEWLECGAYDEPVVDENAVHDLEHGAVWITYDPALADDDVAALEAQLPQNGIMSPYDGLPAPVVVTVWGRQLALTGADDPRLPLFVEEFDDGVTAPEAFASCAGGTAVGPPTA